MSFDSKKTILLEKTYLYVRASLGFQLEGTSTEKIPTNNGFYRFFVDNLQKAIGNSYVNILYDSQDLTLQCFCSDLYMDELMSSDSSAIEDVVEELKKNTSTIVEFEKGVSSALESNHQDNIALNAKIEEFESGVSSALASNHEDNVALNTLIDNKLGVTKFYGGDAQRIYTNGLIFNLLGFSPIAPSKLYYTFDVDDFVLGLDSYGNFIAHYQKNLVNPLSTTYFCFKYPLPSPFRVSLVYTYNATDETSVLRFKQTSGVNLDVSRFNVLYPGSEKYKFQFAFYFDISLSYFKELLFFGGSNKYRTSVSLIGSDLYFVSLNDYSCSCRLDFDIPLGSVSSVSLDFDTSVSQSYLESINYCLVTDKGKVFSDGLIFGKTGDGFLRSGFPISLPSGATRLLSIYPVLKS